MIGANTRIPRQRLPSTSFINIATDKRRLTNIFPILPLKPLSLTFDRIHPAPSQTFDYLLFLAMADAAVENPANTVPPHKKQLPSSIPNFDTLEGFSTEGNDDYSTFKKLQRQLEYVTWDCGTH